MTKQQATENFILPQQIYPNNYETSFDHSFAAIIDLF